VSLLDDGQGTLPLDEVPADSAASPEPGTEGPVADTVDASPEAEAAPSVDAAHADSEPPVGPSAEPTPPPPATEQP
jgi:hypothetical protein